MKVPVRHPGQLACAALLLAGAAMVSGMAPPAGTAPPAETRKGYLIAEIAVTNPDAYQSYVSVVPAILAKCGGRYLARAGRTRPREGSPVAGRIVVVEFPSLAAAEACLDGPEYKAIEHRRTDNAVSRVFLVEGLEPQ